MHTVVLTYVKTNSSQKQQLYFSTLMSNLIKICKQLDIGIS